MKGDGTDLRDFYVLIGNFGSGKTELALNFAFRARARGDRTLLVDIDMVNTYFRLSERRAAIEERGIRLVSPNYAMTNIETLSMPAEVNAAFHSDWDTVVFDAGGDPSGATVLGAYNPEFLKLAPGALKVYNVINTRRPLAGTADKAIALMENMAGYARLEVTGLINNTNLAVETGPDELEDGYHVVREVSERTGVPVAYTSGKKEMLDKFLAGNHDPKYVGQALELTSYMHRDWDSYVNSGV